MKLYILGLVVFGAVSSIAIRDTSSCSVILQRREFRDLSSSEWSMVASTVTKMQNLGWFHWFAFIHVHFFNVIHFVPIFLPWHRRFILEFENVAKYYSPSFSLPYFDPTLDFSNPSNSEFFSGTYMGSSVDPSTNCVTDGIQTGWIMTYPNSHCLNRQFTFTSDPNSPFYWISPEVLYSTIQTSTDFRSFETAIENGIHATIHSTIGGDMSSRYSPNDFSFFLHHSNIDRLWSQWQNIDPSYAPQYFNDPGKPQVSLQDTIFGFPDVVQDVMALARNGLCYSYSDSRYTSISSKRDISFFSSAVSASQIPNMSLSKTLNQETLEKYFPKLDPNGSSVLNIKLPTKLSIKASQVVSVVSSASINSTVPATNSTSAMQAPATQRQSLINSTAVIDTLQNIDPGLLEQVKMPYPSRLSVEFMEMHGFDQNIYNSLYSEMTKIVDVLNEQGYISPYI
ncbi:Tyrosinase [Smittium mucronatum]|uniref:Tyrosinase n=1 Tax=Smittium mucronatum TaxID=133383 RepID=A0A1R0H9J9_9FUNG|nr:Tyrosinase [Smittium mucronatum]